MNSFYTHKRKPGRPRKPNAKRSSVNIRCEEADKAEWIKKAKAQELPLSQWILGRLNQS